MWFANAGTFRPHSSAMYSRRPLLLQTRKLLGAAAIFAAAACSSPEAQVQGVEEDKKGVAPAGSDAALVSHTIPAVMGRNEQLSVSVTMRNTGVSTPANNWTPEYQLRRTAANVF